MEIVRNAYQKISPTAKKKKKKYARKINKIN